jgi:succinoglycan biosynthesis transport protein ExoP
MDLRQYARVLRAHWLLIVVSIVVCTALAAAVAWTRPPTYAAETQLYVSTSIPSGDASPTERYAALLLSQQRAVSYTQLIASPAVVEGINEELGLSLSPEEFRAKVSAVRPEGTVLIDVTATDRSPRLAQAIAQAIGTEFPRFLESLDGQQTSPVDVSVTRPAQLPADPVSPRKTLYLLLGMILGLMVGVGVAVIREALGRRIRAPEDVAEVTGLPVLGSIAELRRGERDPLVMLNSPASVRAEEYRRVRMNLDGLIKEHEIRSIVVSSAIAGEGKTLIAANLGIAFAQSGHRVVLVDADLRRSELTEVMGLTPVQGLTDVLAKAVPIERALASWRPELHLDLLAAGSPHQNPSELLDSRRFAAVLDALSMRADLVILDTPALLPATDAAVLARLTGGAVLVARAGSTRADQLVGAVESLHSVDARVLGVVVNRLPTRRRRYGAAYVSEPRSKGEHDLVAEEPAVEDPSAHPFSPSSRA